jgi:excisionase family DNA binding protein
MPVDRLTYSVAEAADRLSISKVTLYSRIRDGQVRSFLWGGRRLIRHDDLQAAVDLASGRPPERQDDGAGGRGAEP